MQPFPKVVFIGISALCWRYCPAQDATQLVQKAIQARDTVKASQLQLQAAKKTASGLGAPPATRLEAGTGTRPDVSGGEDLTLFQPFDVFGKARAARAGGTAGIRTAEANLRQVEIGVQTDVLTNLAAWTSATRSFQIAKDQLEIAKQLERATKVRVDVRALPEIQMTRASLEVQKAEQVIIDRQSLVQAAMVKLQQSLGGTVPEGLTSFGPETVVALPQPERDRPELLMLNSQRAGFSADKKQARLSLMPDVEIQARRSPWSTNEQYGARLQLVIPLWDHGAARQKAAAAQRGVEASDLEYSDTLKRISAEIAAAKIQLEAAKKSKTAYTKLADGAKSLMDKTQRGFELGANTLIDVLDAKRALSDAMDQLSTAQLNLDLAMSELLRAQGQILGEDKP